MTPGLFDKLKNLNPKRRKETRKQDIMEFPYVWDRDTKPSGHRGRPCKRIGWENRSQGLVVIEFKGESTPFIVQKDGLLMRTPIQ